MVDLGSKPALAPVLSQRETYNGFPEILQLFSDHDPLFYRIVWLLYLFAF